MADNRGLAPLNEPGRRSGFANLMRLENGRWWSTRRGWLLFLVMALLLNGLLAYGIWVVPVLEPTEPNPEFAGVTTDIILVWMSILSVLAAIFLAQNAVIGEKESGVAAWILSAPVTRGAVILAKFAANGLGLLLTTVWLQGGLMYVQFSLSARMLLPVIPLTAALLLQSLYLLFYLALVLLLGTLTRSRPAVLGIAFVFLIGQPFVVSAVEDAAPRFAWALPARLPELARYAHRWDILPSSSAIFVTLGLVVIFLVLAIYSYRREEF